MPSSPAIDRAFAAYDMRIRMRHKPELDRVEIVVYGLTTEQRERLNEMMVQFQLSRDLVESDFTVRGEVTEEQIDIEQAQPSAREMQKMRAAALQAQMARRRDAEALAKRMARERSAWANNRLAKGTGRAWGSGTTAPKRASYVKLPDGSWSTIKSNAVPLEEMPPTPAPGLGARELIFDDEDDIGDVV